MSNLSEDDLTVIEKVISAKNSELWSRVKNGTLTEEDKNALQQSLLDEMYVHGMLEKDEPNEYGKQLDSIVGRLGFSE